MLCGNASIVILLLQHARQFMYLPSGYLSKLTKLWSHRMSEHRMIEHRMIEHSVCTDC